MQPMSQDALALFMEACGATGPLRLSVGQPGNPQLETMHLMRGSKTATALYRRVR
jgi:hypothetical protein